VESQESTRGLLDGGDSLEVQALLGFSGNHASEHAVHVAHGGSENVHSGAVYKVFRFFRGRESL